MSRILHLICIGLVALSAAMAADLGQLQQSFMARYDEANAERDKNLKRLEASYLGALERHMDKVRGSGELERVILIRDEIEVIEAGKDPLPALPEGTSRDLESMRSKYVDARSKVLKSHAEALLALSSKMEEALKIEESRLTKAGRIEDALAAKRMRETLASDAGVSAARDRLGGGNGSPGPRLGEWLPLLGQKMDVDDQGKNPVGKLSEIAPEDRVFWAQHFGDLDEADAAGILVSPSPCRIRFRCSQKVTKLRGKVALAVPNGEATVRIKAGDAKILEKRLFAEDRSDTFDLEFSADQTIEIEVDDNNHPGNDWIYWTNLEVR